MPRDEALQDEYEAGTKLTDIFPVNSVGIVTTHDQFAISWTPEEAVAKVERLLATASEGEARRIWRLCSQNQWQYDHAKRGLADDSWRRRIVPILYRPFDTRMTVFDRNVAVNRRERVTRHMLAGKNLGLVTVRQVAEGIFNHAYVANSIADFRTTLSNKGGAYLFPLYLYPPEGSEDLGKAREANLAPDFIAQASEALGLAFSPGGRRDLETVFRPRDIFRYLYAVLHSPAYRRRYAPFLKSDFPRVPITGNRALFAELARLGRKLVALHLMEAEGSDPPAFPVAGSNRIGKVRYAPPTAGAAGRVWIGDRQYFEGIAPQTWAFAIGGYRPAEKWLKDRRHRTLAFGDIAHYRRLVAALAETRRLMAAIDEAIEAAGGWPLR